MDLRKLVLLHSNDMHGDFFNEEQQDKMVGGLSLLSGYIRKARENFENTFYVISGDMLQGSIIDSEFKGISTIDLVNMLQPDVASIGNHDADYGVGHLLFLERCAKFPIINANLYINPTMTRLFKPYYMLEQNGIRILFIGIITEEVIKQGGGDPLLGTFINVKDASKEIEKICNAYNHVDVDLTVLLTHIGFEKDVELAKTLDPKLGVDIIIGGHSHTFLEEPREVNNILITQAGVGTDFIGRFDITIDMDNNCVHDYKWELVPIDDSHCERDLFLEDILNKYKAKTDEKYTQILTRFKHVLYHEDRYRETALGNLFADICLEQFGVDIFLFGSGSIRKDQMGEIVTFANFIECLPFPDNVYAITIKGSTLKKMLINYWKKFGNRETHEFYQYSRGLHCAFDLDTKELVNITFNELPIPDEEKFVIGLQSYQMDNVEVNFGLSKEELSKLRPIRTISTDVTQAIYEYFINHRLIESSVEGRILMYKDRYEEDKWKDEN